MALRLRRGAEKIFAAVDLRRLACPARRGFHQRWLIVFVNNDEMVMRSLRTELLMRIFSGSTSMVGACLAGIGLLHIMGALGRVSVLGDDLLAADALLFLLAAFFSFWALRIDRVEQALRHEKVADVLFLLALTLMVLICLVLVYAVTRVP